MFAQVLLESGDSQPVVYVASEAIIHTGTRSVAIVAGEQGRFTPTVVVTGGEVDGKTVILDGLKQGQRVVASGQFLIDSEASLKGAATRLGESAPAQEHRGEAKVEKVGPQSVTLSHGPIPSMQWGPMTMDFKLPAGGAPAGLKEGDVVTFSFKSGKAGDFEITSIGPKK